MTALGIFLAALALVAYAYAGYPALCFLRARLMPRPIARRPIRPRVTVIVAAFREAKIIVAKLENLAAQSYPADLTDLVIACDGSDDGTPEIARAAGERLFGDRLTVLALPERHGKPTALNAAAAAAKGSVFVLTDARQPLAVDAIERLVEDLGDPDVGAVGGKLVLGGDEPVGAYWKYESLLRELEGRAGSTVGVSGALYAIRRELFEPLPEGTILDDLLVPMRVRLAGLRVAFDRLAIAEDQAAPSGREFQRKVRTLSGNFQLLLLEPALLAPWRNPSWLDFISHKLLRLAVPWALMTALVASALLPAPWSILLVGGQAAAYGLAALRGMKLLAGSRVAGLAETFVVLNAAAVVALFRFLRHGRNLPW